MTEERLSGLAVMAIELEETQKLMQPNGLDYLIERFAESNSRRL